jgi:hypothetical protein
MDDSDVDDVDSGALLSPLWIDRGGRPDQHQRQLHPSHIMFSRTLPCNIGEIGSSAAGAAADVAGDRLRHENSSHILNSSSQQKLRHQQLSPQEPYQLHKVPPGILTNFCDFLYIPKRFLKGSQYKYRCE